MTVSTLCHILKGSYLLLQKKSEGLFGAGKWNGVGGKCLSDETPEACIRREVYEETGLSIRIIQHHGVLAFTFDLREPDLLTVHVFSTREFDGAVKANDEGMLQWFAFEDIPYHAMWLDDRYWLPLLLAGKRFQGVFHFNQEGTVIHDWNLREII